MIPLRNQNKKNNIQTTKSRKVVSTNEWTNGVNDQRLVRVLFHRRYSSISLFLSFACAE